MSQITLTLPKANRRVAALKLKFLESFLKLAGSDLEICFWPLKPADVPDRRNLRLVFLSPLHPYLGSETIPFANELSSLAENGFRKFKKTLLLVAMDERTAARVMLGLPSGKNIETPDVVFAYKFLGYLGHKGLRWKHFTPVGKKSSRSLTKHIVDFSIAEKVLLQKISPHVLVKHLSLGKETAYPISSLLDRFLSEPKLPIIESERVLASTLQQGIQTGVFVVSGSGGDADLTDALSRNELSVRLGSAF